MGMYPSDENGTITFTKNETSIATENYSICRAKNLVSLNWWGYADSALSADWYTIGTLSIPQKDDYVSGIGYYEGVFSAVVSSSNGSFQGMVKVVGTDVKVYLPNGINQRSINFSITFKV